MRGVKMSCTVKVRLINNGFNIVTPLAQYVKGTNGMSHLKLNNFIICLISNILHTNTLDDSLNSIINLGNGVICTQM